MRWTTLLLLTALGGAASVCGDSRNGAQGTAGRVVDSVLSREEALQRFRSELPATSSLQGGSPSREKLIVELVRAVEERDTASLASLAVTRAEFAYLYYPTAPQSLPPYGLDPALMWHLLVQRSDRGLRRALSTYGGQRQHLLSYDCGEGPSREGDNTVWGPCVFRTRNERGDTVSIGLVSQIIERGGRYKVLSYANKL